MNTSPMNIEALHLLEKPIPSVSFPADLGQWTSCASHYRDDHCDNYAGVTVIKDGGDFFQPTAHTGRLVKAMCNRSAVNDAKIAADYSVATADVVDEQTPERWMSLVKHNALSPSFWKGLIQGNAKARTIHVTRDEDLLWIIWEGLAAGNSDTLVAYLSEVTEEQVQALNNAALIGNTHCILITSTQQKMQRGGVKANIAVIETH